MKPNENLRKYRKTGKPQEVLVADEECLLNGPLTSRKLQNDHSSHYDYLLYLRQQLTKAEEEKLSFRRKANQAEDVIQMIKKEIYQTEVQDEVFSKPSMPIFNLILNTQKEKRIRHNRLISLHDKQYQQEVENLQCSQIKESEIAEKMNLDRKMKIIENLEAIKQRSEFRMKKNQLSNRLLNVIKKNDASILNQSAYIN